MPVTTVKGLLDAAAEVDKVIGQAASAADGHAQQAAPQPQAGQGAQGAANAASGRLRHLAPAPAAPGA